MVKKISEKQFEEVLNENIALVDFSAKWCGPCKMLEPILEEVSEELKDITTFFNIDVDENPALAQKFGITSIPALILLKNGEMVDMEIGFQPKENIINFIKTRV